MKIQHNPRQQGKTFQQRCIKTATKLSENYPISFEESWCLVLGYLQKDNLDVSYEKVEQEYSLIRFKQEYQGIFEPDEWEEKSICGECKFFGYKGCTTSYIEAKYGNSKTPACTEFEKRINEK